MIENIINIIKSSIIFIAGFALGIIAGLVGLGSFFVSEVYGIPLLIPFTMMFILVVYFIIMFFKEDKIEQINRK